MNLNAALERLEQAGLNPALQRQPKDDILNRTIGHLAHDSRAVQSEGAFVAIRGESADGHLFIDKAVQNGARVVVCEAFPDEAERRSSPVVFVRVDDSRAALAELAALFHGDPARDLRMVGITGTNGKTTTTQLVHHMLQALGEKAGLLGTIAIRIGNEEQEASLTTPDPLILHQTLRRMADAGCNACAMEVSSHALTQKRVQGIDFDVAVFMNLSQDHLDYHGSMEAYLSAKKLLFDSLSEEATALYNCDDEAGEKMVADTAATVRSFGTHPTATYRVAVIDNSLDGLRLRLDGEDVRFKLVGRFNAYNLTAAYAVARAFGYSRTQALNALATAPSVRGRFEQLQSSTGLRAIVDYAHTPDALANVLRTLREATEPETRLWCVFGCGGDRDRGKRPQMGRIAEEWADRLVVTSDNPRTEDPSRIIADIRAGLHQPERAWYEVDRRRAIERSIREAASSDVVLIAGKGHETYQIVGAEKRPFDDREEVRRSFQRRDSAQA